MQNASHPPVLLVIAGNDPSGGAGLAADVQVATALGIHPAPVTAALTVQDTRNVSRVLPLDPGFVVEQARHILEDMPVAVVKLGLLADAAIGRAVAAMLKSHGRIPLVVDPVLRASGGGVLAEDDLIGVYLEDIFPLATLITPNAAEGRRLAPEAGDVAGRAHALLKTGVGHVLMKGADEDTPEVHNILFSKDGSREEFTWSRLPGVYHGSGCTLAAAAAAYMAQGERVTTAVREAQRYTWETLKHSWQLGRGQHIPNRQTRR